MGYKILYKNEVCKNQFEIKVKAPYITKNAKAGQFIILRVDKNSERIPLTIADYDRENEVLTIVYMAVGYTTKNLPPLMSAMKLKISWDLWENPPILKNTARLYVLREDTVLPPVI